MKESWRTIKMLKEDIIKWVEKTFGKPKHGDNFEMISKISEGRKQGAIYLIEELNFVFQRRENDITEKEIKIWKQELDDLSGKSLIAFNFANNEVHAIANDEDIKKGAREGELIKGRGTMLNVRIFKKTFIANAIVFPSKINSHRRH